MKTKKVTKLISMTLIMGGAVIFQSALMFSADAEIFKCTNKQGAVYYNDKPCPVVDEEKILKNEKDVINGYIPSTKKEDSIKKPAKGAVTKEQTTRVIIEKPEQSEDISESEQNGSVSNDFFHHSNSSNNKQNIKRKKLGSDESDAPLGADSPKMTNKKVDGKFTIQQKRAMLGIFPADR